MILEIMQMVLVAASNLLWKRTKRIRFKRIGNVGGMFKNSSLYNPRSHRNPEGVKNRRNVVLSSNGKIWLYF